MIFYTQIAKLNTRRTLGVTQRFIWAKTGRASARQNRPGSLLGFFQVFRPELAGEIEHKFYVNLTEDEEAAVFLEFAPVLREHGRFDSMNELLQAMEPFKNER